MTSSSTPEVVQAMVRLVDEALEVSKKRPRTTAVCSARPSRTAR